MSGRVCKRCVLDDSVPHLRLDGDGVCAYCRMFAREWPRYSFTPEQETRNLQTIVERIRRRSKGEYHCTIGVSGGVDSSFLVHLASTLGLKCLLVHFDNGWNAPVSAANIQRLVRTTGFDLQTYVVDWDEFRDLQRAYIRAGVIDIEAITDHAIFSAVFRMSRAAGSRSMLSGTNFATEHGLPPEWIWQKLDWANIRDIHKTFGKVRLRTYPHMTLWRFFLLTRFGKKIRIEHPLNLMNYRKLKAIEILKNSYGWQPYGAKHGESVFTNFYQSYVLPRKFGVDKRKVHFSALVRVGELTRDDALAQLEKSSYGPGQQEQEKRYVLKKLGFEEQEFDLLMKSAPRSHADFSSDVPFLARIRTRRALRRLG